MHEYVKKQKESNSRKSKEICVVESSTDCIIEETSLTKEDLNSNLLESSETDKERVKSRNIIEDSDENFIDNEKTCSFSKKVTIFNFNKKKWNLNYF